MISRGRASPGRSRSIIYFHDAVAVLVNVTIGVEDRRRTGAHARQRGHPLHSQQSGSSGHPPPAGPTAGCRVGPSADSAPLTTPPGCSGASASAIAANSTCSATTDEIESTLGHAQEMPSCSQEEEQVQSLCQYQPGRRPSGGVCHGRTVRRDSRRLHIWCPFVDRHAGE